MEESEPKKEYKYIIGSGWWCNGQGRNDIDGSRLGKNISDFTRTPEFSKIWYHFINKYTKPEKIIIIDSDSPVKPILPSDKRIEFLNMKKNFGDPRHRQGQFSGGERAFMMGCWYALMNDVDYFIYIEQDCLVYGKGWVEKVIENLNKVDTQVLGEISYSELKSQYWYLGTEKRLRSEWCLTVIRTTFIREFLNKYLNFDITKYRISEAKFNELSKVLGKKYRNIPFGYGRNRPINFNDKHFYSQQFTKDELIAVLKKEGLKYDIN